MDTMLIEPPRRPLAGIRQILESLSGVQASNAFVAFIFAISAPIAIIIGAGIKGGLTQVEIASWIFAAFTVNGILSIGLSVAYRMPLVHLWAIPGAVLTAQALTHLSFPEVIGAYIACGLLLLALGLTGVARRIMSWLPLPIVMGMVAGIFLQFGLDWIKALNDDPWIAVPMTITYFALSLSPALGRRIPPLIGVLVVGIAAVAASGGATFSDGPAGSPLLERLAWPSLFAPRFSLQAMIELVIPLAVTVLVAQNAQGLAILRTAGFTPPVNAITAGCGVGSLATACFGCVPTCLAGPSNAILCSADRREDQFAAAILFSVFAMIFGTLAPLVIVVLLATPPAFVAALAGLALLRVLQQAFQTSFSNSFTLGAMVAFMVTIADRPLFSIGAPFWSIVAGMLTSLMLERCDFRSPAPKRASEAG
jgi:benzoate membrane transport protein